MIEAAGDNSSIVTDYQYEKTTYSDSQFMKDYLEKEDVHQEQVTVVTDGAYSGKINEELATEKNVQLVTTNLTGREAQDIAADFEFNKDGTKVEKCAGALNPKATAIIPRQASARFPFTAASANNVLIKTSAAPKPSNAPTGKQYPQTQNGVPSSRDTGIQRNLRSFPISATE